MKTSTQKKIRKFQHWKEVKRESEKLSKKRMHDCFVFIIIFKKNYSKNIYFVSSSVNIISLINVLYFRVKRFIEVRKNNNTKMYVWQAKMYLKFKRENQVIVLITVFVLNFPCHISNPFPPPHLPPLFAPFIRIPVFSKTW